MQINELGYNAFVACSRLKKMFFKRGVSAGRILVAYYSAGASAESFARKIFADSSCDFVGIRPKRPYPGEYGERIERYSCENRIGLLPEICGVSGRMEEYGEVYLLCPACLGFIPPPLKSFLCMYDFSGKVLRLFCLCAPERPPDFALSVRRLCPRAAVEIYCARSANFAAHCPYSIRRNP
ncbi:MAG: hypothetical protein DBX55_09820 [Verrucomicrobia bacterium]|nr:MAG: hypothetical protein DBX55_09820 [Verrucomicrobiota bacterium]